MASRSNQSACYGDAAAKPKHRYSTTDSNSATARRRQSMFENQPVSQNGSAHRVSYQGTDIRASESQHRARVEEEMARIMGQFSGRR